MARRLIGLFLVFTFILSALPAIAAPGAPAALTATTDAPPSFPAKTSRFDPNDDVRVIVQLANEPLATYAGGLAAIAATKPQPGARLDVASPASRSYRGYLAQQQAQFASGLAILDPGARIDLRYDVVFNGVAATVKFGDLASIRDSARRGRGDAGEGIHVANGLQHPFDRPWRRHSRWRLD